MHKILIIGGTSEGYRIASMLEKDNRYHPILSLQGNTEKPHIRNYNVRFGGFGGVIGLKKYIKKNQISAIIDASHPYAQQISKNVYLTCQNLNKKLFAIYRPIWRESHKDLWIRVESFHDAKNILNNNDRVFLTIGKKFLPIFVKCTQWFMIRTIDRNDVLIKNKNKYISGRGPFHVSQELNLLRNNRITHIISRNSGGKDTYAKILAARALGIKVIIVDRVDQDSDMEKIRLKDLFHQLNNHFGLNK
tara:strand:+ start:8796 stop:9539 length:744 start_codon:yes stop_codon:yes gene_type:complete